MSDQACYYLRENVYFEPLFNQWYAWPYLLPPATAARHLTNTHRRIMSSFVKNYKLHIMAVNNPGMAGSEFLDCSEEQVGAVKELLDKITTEYADMVELSEAIKTLDDMLREHKSGETVEVFYDKVPTPLKGFVELFLDMNHQPGYRFVEGLMYHSKYYKPQMQSISLAVLPEGGERPFILSTPRFADDDNLQMSLPFVDKRLDQLFSARETPITQAQMDEIFKDQPTSGGLTYQDLFTTDLPSRSYQPLEQGLRLSYIGHAGFMLETPDVTIMIDPVIAVRTEQHADELISFSQLPPTIDYLCLTHNHQDHVNIETLLQLRYKVKKVLVPKNNGGTIVDPSIKLLLQQIGFEVFEVEDMEQIPVVGGKITALPFLGEHGDLFIRSKAAWHVNLGGKSLFFGADSSNLDPNMYQHIKDCIGGVDILAIGMECVGAPYTWIYGALTTKTVSKKIKDSRRLNGSGYDEAMAMVKTFEPGEVYIYALGMEPWYKYFMGLDYDDDSKQIVESNKMLEHCKEMGLPIERMYGKKVVVFDEPQ